MWESRMDNIKRCWQHWSQDAERYNFDIYLYLVYCLCNVFNIQKSKTEMELGVRVPVIFPLS
jgi:hypothetical protein